MEAANTLSSASSPMAIKRATANGNPSRDQHGYIGAAIRLCVAVLVLSLLLLSARGSAIRATSISPLGAGGTVKRVKDAHFAGAAASAATADAQPADTVAPITAPTTIITTTLPAQPTTTTAAAVATEQQSTADSSSESTTTTTTTRPPPPTKRTTTTLVPTTCPGIDPKFAYVGALLGLPWPLPELRWEPAEHGGRPAPHYHMEDYTMDEPTHEGLNPPDYTPENGFTPTAILVDSAAEVSAFADKKEAEGYFQNTSEGGGAGRGGLPTKSHLIGHVTRCRASGQKDKGESWSRSDEEVEGARNLKQRYGILTTPKFMHQRLLSMLRTTLANVTTVDLFFRKSLVSHHYVRYLLGKVRETHAHAAGIRVVELYGPDAEALKTNGYNHRNAWTNMEVIRFWRAEHEAEEAGKAALADGKVTEADLPAWLHAERTKRSRAVGIASTIADLDKDGKMGEKGSGGGGSPPRSDTPVGKQWPYLHALDWYSIMDDDGYAFLQSMRTTLFAFGRERGMERPAHVGHPMSSYFGARAIVHGGPGLHFNVAALKQLTFPYVESCEKRFRSDAGDVVSGLCMSFLNIPVSRLRQVTWMDPVRAIRDMWFDYSGAYPAAFHEVRNTRTAARLATIERLRAERGEIPSWDDVLVNIMPHGRDVLHNRYKHCVYCHAHNCGVRIPRKRPS